MPDRFNKSLVISDKTFPQQFGDKVIKQTPAGRIWLHDSLRGVFDIVPEANHRSWHYHR